MSTGNGSLSIATNARIAYAETGMNDVKNIANDFSAIDDFSEWNTTGLGGNSVMSGGYTLDYTPADPSDLSSFATLVATVDSTITSASELRVFVPQATVAGVEVDAHFFDYVSPGATLDSNGNPLVVENLLAAYTYVDGTGTSFTDLDAPTGL